MWCFLPLYQRFYLPMVLESLGYGWYTRLGQLLDSIVDDPRVRHFLTSHRTLLTFTVRPVWRLIVLCMWIRLFRFVAIRVARTLKRLLAHLPAAGHLSDCTEDLESRLHRYVGGPFQRGVCASLVWLPVNFVFVRPLFRRLSTQAFDEWRCSASSDGTQLNDTGLEVIVASPGHTGTTSMRLALSTLGLRTYGNEDIDFYMPDVLLRETVQAADLVPPLRSCGVGAFAPEPYLDDDLVPKLLSVSPRAKVIFMVREWSAWAKSAWISGGIGWYQCTATLLRNSLLCHWLPHGLLWPRAGRGRSVLASSLTSVMIDECVMRSSGRMARQMHRQAQSRRGLVQSMRRNETLYDAYRERIRRLVPPDRFLQFDVAEHGWPELRAFLGGAAPAPRAPFPRARVRSICPDAVKWTMFPMRCLTFWTLMTVSIFVNYAVFLCLLWFVRRTVHHAAERLAFSVETAMQHAAGNLQQTHNAQESLLQIAADPHLFLAFHGICWAPCMLYSYLSGNRYGPFHFEFGDVLRQS